MQVIVGHNNADFDCLASMVAARVLYPDALIVFPGGTEQGVNDFISRHGDSLPVFSRSKDIALDAVTRLILVDCQQPERIGRFAGCLDNAGISVHVFDHHPVTDASVMHDGGCISTCGSTATILTKIVRERGFNVTSQEATLIMLGIYEDTGKLLFAGTTAEDYHAAAWLLEQGGDLQIVSDYVSRGLTAAQISILDSLLRNLSHRTINGVNISLSFAASEEYVADISRLAHMICDMESLDALFLVVDMGSSLSMVARSRVSGVDAGEIMRKFDGGGHSAAASATVRDKSLKYVFEHLETILALSISSCKTARSLMSSPVKTLPSGITISAAHERLINYNCTSMPVMKRKRVVGIISRKTLEKALYHHLGGEPVDEYMHTEFIRATPETPIVNLQKTIVEENQRFVPVFEEGSLVGAVTRTDLLRHMYNGASGNPEAFYDVETLGFVTRHHSLGAQLKKQLSQPVLDLLHELGSAGDSLGMAVYAVGGFVRDLILGVENFDIDITVEGDGIFFAEQFVMKHNCRIRSHQVFGTAVIIFPDGSKIDIASTRLEYYESPGVLPTVERSSLRHDLYRRDFTINTLAVCLNQDCFGVVTDYFGGRQDLQKRAVKVLHNLSFVEDPSRVFRAIRFEQRLGFTLSPHTENLIRSTIRMNGLDALGGTRMYNELVLILKEKQPAPVLQRMAALNIFPSIHPALKLTPETDRIIHETEQVLAWFRLMYLPDQCDVWQVYFLALTSNLLKNDFAELLVRLAVPRGIIERVFNQRGRVVTISKNLQRHIRKKLPVADSVLYKQLHGLEIESLLFLASMAREDEIRRQVSHYLTHLRSVQTALDGNDLKELGLKPGPVIGKVLNALLIAKLDGKLIDREQELEQALVLIEYYMKD